MSPSPYDGCVSAELEGEVCRLYHENAPGLLRYGAPMAGGAEAAQDAVQEAFLRYFLARAAGQRMRNPRAWLFHVLRNVLLDQRRVADWRKEIGLDQVPDSADQQQDPELLYSGLELARSLVSALAPRELECIRLRAEGLQYDEIAEVLGVRPGTVAALLARAHQKYRRLSDAESRSRLDLTAVGEKS